MTITSALVLGAGDFAIGDLRAQAVCRQLNDRGFDPECVAKTKSGPALCRKVAEKISDGEIDSRRNGSRTKSFLDVNGYLEGTQRLRPVLFRKSPQRA